MFLRWKKEPEIAPPWSHMVYKVMVRNLSFPFTEYKHRQIYTFTTVTFTHNKHLYVYRNVQFVHTNITGLLLPLSFEEHSNTSRHTHAYRPTFKTPDTSRQLEQSTRYRDPISLDAIIRTTASFSSRLLPPQPAHAALG